MLIFFLEGTAASGFGIAVSAACPNEKLMLALAPALTIIFILFGGFYINTASIPRWLFWYVRVDFYLTCLLRPLIWQNKDAKRHALGLTYANLLKQHFRYYSMALLGCISVTCLTHMDIPFKKNMSQIITAHHYSCVRHSHPFMALSTPYVPFCCLFCCKTSSATVYLKYAVGFMNSYITSPWMIIDIEDCWKTFVRGWGVGGGAKVWFKPIRYGI